eukprot:5303654-Karenia_brevis.AAC.1
MRPDTRGTCGCLQGPRFCKYAEGHSWEERRDWMKAAQECEQEVEQAVHRLFTDMDKIFGKSPFVEKC